MNIEAYDLDSLRKIVLTLQKENESLKALQAFKSFLVKCETRFEPAPPRSVIACAKPQEEQESRPVGLHSCSSKPYSVRARIWSCT